MKNNIIVTSILLFITLIAWAQPETKKQNKWGISYIYSPDIYLRSPYNSNYIYLGDGVGYGTYGYYMDSPGFRYDGFKYGQDKMFDFYNIGINFTTELIGQLTIKKNLT